jgi:hypothetical protein
MSATKKTTYRITLPDGSTATRTSARPYTHGVIISRTAAAQCADMLAQAEACRERARRHREAAEDGTVKIRSRGYGDWREFVLAVPGEQHPLTWNAQPDGRTALVGDEIRPAREFMPAYAREIADENDRRAEELTAAADSAEGDAPGVVRWSSRYELAAKAVAGELAWYAQHGYDVTIAAID